MRKTITILFFSTFICSVSHAQNALKQYKQKTTFFYSQLNLHGGLIHDTNGKRWDVSNQGPNNQLAFRLMRKDQRTMQRGYIRSVRPVIYSLRFIVLFDKTIVKEGQWAANVKLQLLDTWVRFNTKWDRTSIWIGNKAIPYGHNPLQDRVTSFMTNLVQMDLGFFQDLGVFLKMPIHKRFDLELSITTGGLLNKPVLCADNIITNTEKEAKPTFTFGNYSYDNTWLITGRIGNQSFRINEFGLIGVSGRINNTIVTDDQVRINRIGLDWVYKYREKIKISNQLIFGLTNSEAEKLFGTLNYQGNVDLYLFNRIVISTSFACNYHNSLSSNLYHFNFTHANSITYTISPNTRIRINGHYSKTQERKEKRSGILLQFVTGIGKRD